MRRFYNPALSVFHRLTVQVATLSIVNSKSGKQMGWINSEIANGRFNVTNANFL